MTNHVDPWYDQKCAQAASDQGLDPMVDALRDNDIEFEVCQARGFTMVVEVLFNGNGHVEITRTLPGVDDDTELNPYALFWRVIHYHDDANDLGCNEPEGSVIHEAAPTAMVIDTLANFKARS